MRVEIVIQELVPFTAKCGKHKSLVWADVATMREAEYRMSKQLMIKPPRWLTSDSYCTIWITEIDNDGKRTENFIRRWKCGPHWSSEPYTEKPWRDN